MFPSNWVIPWACFRTAWGMKQDKEGPDELQNPSQDKKKGPAVMEMERRIHQPFPKGMISRPCARPEDGEGDEAGTFGGTKTTTRHFPPS